MSASTIDWHTPIEAYHAAQHVSASKLKTFASGGPRHYFMRHVQGVSDDTRSDALVFGQSFEDLLIEPSEWAKKYLVKPEGVSLQTKVGKAWAAMVAGRGEFDRRFIVAPAGLVLTRKDGKAWKAEHAQDRTVLTVEEHEESLALLPVNSGIGGESFIVLDAGDAIAMQAMAASVRENETAMALIRGARAQATIRWARDGLPGVQSRPDWLSLDGCPTTGFQPYSLDLKTTRHLSCIAGGRDVRSLRYHSQAALVSDGLARAGYVEARCFLLAVEKCSPYRAQVVEVTPEWLQAGHDWCERQMDKLAVHYRTGEWPRVALECVQLPALPRWAANDIEDETEAA